MDEDWSFCPVTKQCRDKAARQLGSSGSGNHFAEFGTLTLPQDDLGLKAGIYTALLSHSGSRGTGGQVATYYSKLAMQLHPELPRELLHRDVVKLLGVKVLLDIENHHNFAWKEQHFGQDVIVHRKGATPAGKGVVGIIPGSQPGTRTPGMTARSSWRSMTSCSFPPAWTKCRWGTRTSNP